MTRLLGAFALAMLCLALPASPRAGASQPVKIVFVDTGNTGRSVTAEALAGATIRARALPILVISRAVDLDPFVTSPEPEVVRLLARRGIDVSTHRAASLTEDDIRHATLILTMTARHKAAVIAAFPQARDRTHVIAPWAAGEEIDVADAMGQSADVYEAMISQLDRLVPLALAKALAARR